MTWAALLRLIDWHALDDLGLHPDMFNRAPASGSRAELVAALRRFREAVTREPHRQLVRVLHT
jgi:hypothetical protein